MYFNIKEVFNMLKSKKKSKGYVFINDHPVDTKRPKYRKWIQLFRKNKLECSLCGSKAVKMKLVECTSDGYIHVPSGKTKHTFFLIDQYGVKMTFDHWIPKSFLKNNNIDDRVDNYILMCETCNRLKGDMVPLHWKIQYNKMKEFKNVQT